MSSAPGEPEKFSIDEMLDRLNGGNSQSPADGELVTRADGTQAIRVKKRKRRSEQPRKEAARKLQRLRNFQIAGVVLLLFALALAFGGMVIYSNSKPFRDSLAAKIAKGTGATAVMERFRINPKTANAGSLTLNWPAGNILKSLSLTKIQAEVSPTSFLGRSFNGDEIVAAQGKMELQLPTADQPATNQGELNFKAIRFNRYRIPDFSLLVGDPAEPAIMLTKSEASLNPVNVSNEPQLSIYNGQLALAGWPNLRLDRALLEFRGQDIEIIGLRMLSETDNKGEFQLSGSVSPYKPESASTLAVTLDSFEISAILGPTLGRLIDGRIDTQATSKSNFFSFFPSQSPTAVLDIAFQSDPSSQFEVRSFPFLFALSRILEDPWFENPVFESDASGLIRRENGVTTLKNLNLESKARMALRGTMSVTSDDMVSGSLQFGLAEGMIISSKNPRLMKVFGPLKDGYRWITLTISGSGGSVKDNFGDLFLSAADSPSLSADKENPAPSSFSELTRPK